MNYISKEFIKNVIEENEAFLNEYQFQFALAMAIKEKYPQLKVKIEQNVYCDNEEQENCRCDIVVENKNKDKVLFIELKYVVTSGKQSYKTSMRARKSFLRDIKRLYNLNKYPNAEKYCIFITNKTAVYNNKTTGNYFNESYAKENLWTPAKFKDTQSVHFLIINADEDGANIPEDFIE